MADDLLPKHVFYVVVTHKGSDEVIHERAFAHELRAKEWAADFGERFNVTMGCYAPSKFPRVAKDQRK